MKTWLIIFALALLAGFVLLRSRSDHEIVVEPSTSSQGPSFWVKVVKPRLARPFMGFLSAEFEAKLAGHGKLGFDHTSRGAKIGTVGPNHLELRAEGWDLWLKTDREGAIGPETRLVFPLILANKQRSLSCRPADPAVGYLDSSQQASSKGTAGRFLIELATCENVKTGKTIDWPPAPLTVTGNFAGLVSQPMPMEVQKDDG